MLKLNLKIKLLFNDTENYVYGTIKILNDKELAIDLINQPKQYAINPSLSGLYEFSFLTPEALIKFKSNFLYEKDKLLFFNIPKLFNKIQRREYTRININLPVKLYINDNEEIAFSRNISAGGMQIQSPVAPKVGTLINLSTELNNRKIINIGYKVLRVDKNEDKELRYFISGVFQNIANIDRISIIQFCFKQQLELRFIKAADNRR